MSEALKVKDSGHPACVGQEGDRYLFGEMGYPVDRSLAKLRFQRWALAGFYVSQEYMRGEHLFGALRFEPADVASYLCWTRVADQISPMAQLDTKCEAYRQGIALDENLKSVTVPPHIQQLAREWCEPSRTVTAQTCADLEQKAERK